MKTSRVSRMVQILTALQSGQLYAADDLAKMLGLSRRMLFRDLKDLQRAGVPYHYDKRAHHYTLDPKFFLPAPGLSTQEALALLLLVYKARNYIHLPFKDSALRAALKIESNLPVKIKRFCNTALRKQVLNIRYYLPHEQKSIVTNLSPYHLMYSDLAWYVLGKSDLHKGVGTFKLSQIEKLNTLDKCFIEGEEFDVSAYLSRAWSMTPEGV